MSSGEFLFVLSQAICHYYYSSLDLTSPPPFHPGFLRWAARLAEPDATQSDVIRFVKYYGTHFLSEVTFGARFVKKHKVSKTNYEELKSSKFSVEAQASYSGAFDVGGGFSMGTKQRSAVAKFQESVETSTVTVGAAPPSNGDALTWAATVQDNPVPSKYSLTPIHELFTETFAQSFNFDLSVVRERLQNASSLYCQYLKKRGAVRTCEDQTSVEGWETILAGVYIPNQGGWKPGEATPSFNRDLRGRTPLSLLSFSPRHVSILPLWLKPWSKGWSHSCPLHYADLYPLSWAPFVGFSTLNLEDS